MDQKDLIRQLQKRDEKAFVTLYDDYAPLLYGIILKIVKRKDIACGVLQEAFLKFWKEINNFDSEKKTLFVWMLSICFDLISEKIGSKKYKAEKKKLQNLLTFYIGSLHEKG